MLYEFIFEPAARLGQHRRKPASGDGPPITIKLGNFRCVLASRRYEYTP